MLLKLRILLILSCFSFLISEGQINQKGRHIPYFNSYTSPKSWDSYKTDVYTGTPASITNINGKIPVDMLQGKGSLVLETVKPGGYWTALFRIGWGKPVNYLRMGDKPYLHLRLKWEKIAQGADLGIQLITQENNIAAGFPQQSATVILSDYTKPSAEWKDVYIPISDFKKNNPKINLTRVVIVGMGGIGTYSETNKMFIETMDIIPVIDNKYLDAVKINMIGYTPEQTKIGIVSFSKGSSSVKPTEFKIINVADGSVAHEGTLFKQMVFNVIEWGQDGDDVYHGEFTALRKPGKYKMLVEELNQESREFEISESAYNKIFRDALRFFYYSRSGEAIVEPYAENYTRKALYDNGVAATYDYKSGTRDIKGGWFDAGDTHLDAHAPFEAVWWLLETLRQFEHKVQKNSLNIPESEKGINDLHELIKYELDWYAKLWNQDGSVHFFVTQNGGKTPTLSDVTSSSAAFLAAMYAKAYPLFKKHAIYSSYADTLLIKAEKSWEWLIKNPNNVSPIEPATGKVYGYSKDSGHDQATRAIAAISLFNTTGKAMYNLWFTSRFKDPLSDYHPNQAWGGIISGLEQSEINLGYMDYIQSAQPDADKNIISKLKAAFITQANWTIERITFTAYNIPLAAPNHLFWGSSGLIATHAYIYDQVFKWTGNLKYKFITTHAVDWILGRNPVNNIFVTGYGDVFHGVDIYSFFWDDNFNAPPGYLCGNIMAYDETTVPIIKDPWKRFMNVQSAATLEPGIYWNAELAWLMGYMASNAGDKRDCNGELNGNAFIDKCGECVEGNTGKKSCTPSNIILERISENLIQVFPNPSDGYFIISEFYGANWQVYSLNGSWLLSGNTEQIDLKGYAPGIYLLKLNGQNVKLVKR